jgi:transposase
MVKGRRINAEAYVKTLKKLKQRINRVRREQKQILLRHDKARSHTSAATSTTVESIGFEVVLHPPFSPDLAPSDFWLFGALKKYLKGYRFTCDEEVRAAMASFENRLENSTATVPKNSFSAGGVVSNERATTWKREVQKQSTQSELRFVSFQYLVWLYRYKYGGNTFGTPLVHLSCGRPASLLTVGTCLYTRLGIRMSSVTDKCCVHLSVQRIY